MSKKGQIILLDADVIIHFMKASKHLSLPAIFPEHRLCVLDIVADELRKFKTGIVQVDNLFTFKTIEQLPFPKNEYSNPIFKEFIQLKKLFGDGESACMAYARFNQNILASSNLRDIKNYCNTHHIQYLTTMDFLCEALSRGIFTESDCDDFIFIVKYKDSKLPPISKMSQYDCSKREVRG